MVYLEIVYVKQVFIIIGVIIAMTMGVEGYSNVFLYQSILLILIFVLAFFLKSHAKEQALNSQLS